MKYRKWICMLCAIFLLSACATKEPVKEEKKKVEESESISGKSIKIEDVIQKKSTSADETKEMQGNQFLIISIIGIVLLALVTILFLWRIKLKK